MKIFVCIYIYTSQGRSLALPGPLGPNEASQGQWPHGAMYLKDGVLSQGRLRWEACSRCTVAEAALEAAGSSKLCLKVDILFLSKKINFVRIFGFAHLIFILNKKNHTELKILIFVIYYLFSLFLYNIEMDEK